MSSDRSILMNRLYRHFKGDLYRTIDIVRHSETEEDMILYRKEGPNGPTMHMPWVRPLSMWLEEVQRDGYQGPRFSLVQAACGDQSKHDTDLREWGKCSTCIEIHAKGCPICGGRDCDVECRTVLCKRRYTWPYTG